MFLCNDAEIAGELDYCYLVVGLRAENLPAKEEEAVMIDFIRKNYGTHRIGEIRVSFDSAIAGRFEVDARAFENFSIQYFANVFNKYREWAASTVNKMKDLREPIMIESTGQEKKGDSWEEIWQRLIVEEWEDNLFYELAPWSGLYDWLKSTQGITPTEEQINQAHVQVLGRLQRKVPQTPSEKQEIERMKCIDWREDMKVLRYISTEVKTITVKQLLHKLKKERNENDKNID